MYRDGDLLLSKEELLKTIRSWVDHTSHRWGLPSCASRNIPMVSEAILNSPDMQRY